MTAAAVTQKFPEPLEFLFKPKRYKVTWGGRGAAKSWGYARALLIQGAQRPLQILCARETQKSIGESVHKLLENQISELGLDDFYDVRKLSILGRTGTQFTFAGLKHNIDNIKSLEGCDICWVEEAQRVSKGSWAKLIPTIRKAGSEIWVTFNPDFEQDSTYERFVLHPPRNSSVVRMNWRDNPWFPPELREEMEELRATDPDEFNHVWEGCCISILEGAIYARELRAVDAEGRIGRVPYDRSKPVHTFWDLGFGDHTSIWFVQAFPFEYRFIDFIDGTRFPLSHYLEQLQKKHYVYGTHWLPHDAKAKTLATGRSIEQMMREAAMGTVQIVPQLSVTDGINAARTLFPQVWFDKEHCADGLQLLRRYRYGTIQTLGSSTREPLHDDASHPADAFRYAGVALKPPKREEPKREQFSDYEHDWMG